MLALTHRESRSPRWLV